MQLVFVGMAMIPIPGLASLLLIESLYLASTLGVYLKHSHLKNLLLLIPKVSQSLILIILEIFLLVFYSRLENKFLSLTKSQQTKIGSLIFFSSIIEYLFLGLHIFWIVKILLEKRKKEMTDMEYKDYV